MSVLIDHELRSNPKWVALTPTQRARLIELWMWIDEQQTDGHIPDFMLPELRVTGRDLAALTTPAVPGKAAWLDRNGTGWIAHDWHDMNAPIDPKEREAWFRRRRQKRHRTDGKHDGNTDTTNDADAT